MINERTTENKRRMDRLLHRRYHPFRLVRAYFFDFWTLLKEARVPLLGFAILTIVNTSYLAFVYDHPVCRANDTCFSPLRALFETIRMYVFEINVDWPADPWGKVLFFVTPLLGIALIFQSVLDFGRFLLDKSSRWEGWQVSLAKTYRNHVILCGLGRISMRVMLQLLNAGYEVVVIERDRGNDLIPSALKLKVPVIVGDARESDILIQAGIMRAHGMLAGINNDIINMEIALAAGHVRPDVQMVMRIFDEELDTNLERSFGTNSAFSSSALAAPTLAAAAVSRNIVRVLPLSDCMIGISEITIAPDHELSGFVRSIEEKYDVRVLRHIDAHGRERHANLMNTLGGGDRVMLLGLLENLEAAHESNQRSKFDFLYSNHLHCLTSQFNTVIVCGLGKVGYRVIQNLQILPRCPEIVVICTPDTHSPFLKEVEDRGIRVIQGDARNPDILTTASIDCAFSVAAVTGDKLVNVQIGLAARRLRSNIHLVLRVFSDVMAEQLEDIFGPHTVFSTADLAAPTLAAAAIVRNIEHAIDIGNQLYSSVNLTVHSGDEFVGRKIGAVREQSNVLVVALRRQGALVLPLKADTCLDVGDDMTVMVPIADLHRLRSQDVQTGEATTRRLLAAQTHQLE